MGFKYNTLIYRLVDSTIEYNILAILLGILLIVLIVYNKGIHIKSKSTNIINILMILISFSIMLKSKIGVSGVCLFDINFILSLLTLFFILLSKVNINNTVAINISSFISIIILTVSSVLVQDIAYGQNFNAVITNQLARLVLTIAIYLIIIPIFFIIIGNTKLASIIYLVTYTILLLINFAVLQGRGTSLQYNDFLVIKTAMNVASGYRLNLTYNICTGILLINTTLAFIINIIPGDIKFSTKLLERISPIIIIYMGIAMIAPYTSQNALENCKIYPRIFQENNYGLAINLYSGAIMHDIDPPNNYSNSTRLLDKFSNTSKIDLPDINISINDDRIGEAEFYNNYYTSLDFLENSNIEKPDNIVVIMAESLCDLRYSDCLEVVNDYMPFIHSLEDDPNVITGEYFSPSLAGGGTAQSEYEVLTGGTTDAMKTDFYAYQTYIKSEYPSIINNMKQSGYRTFAIHNYDKSGYNRENVYKFFGFDSIHFDDDPYFENADTLRGFIKDKNGLNFILDTIKDNDEPTFSFFVTMQGHGDYDRGFSLDEEIENLNYDELNLDYEGNTDVLEDLAPKVTEYCAAQSDFDFALQNFIEELKNSDEKTLVVLYGDHRWGHDIMDASDSSKIKIHLTPLVIWSNYELPDIPENKKLFVGSCYLGSIICKVAGVGLTSQNELLLQLYEKMPGIGVMSYLDSNLNYETNYSNLPDTTVVDLLRAMTYQAITGENKEFYWDIN